MDKAKCQLEPCDHQQKYDALLREQADKFLKLSLRGKIFVLCETFAQKVQVVLQGLYEQDRTHFLDTLNRNLPVAQRVTTPEDALLTAEKNSKFEAALYAFGKQLLESEVFDLSDEAEIRRRLQIARRGEEVQVGLEERTGRSNLQKAVENLAIHIFLKAFMTGAVVIGDEEFLTSARAPLEFPDPTLAEILLQEVDEPEHA